VSRLKNEKILLRLKEKEDKMDRETFERIKKESIDKVIEKRLGGASRMEKAAIRALLEDTINQLMLSERGIFLDKDEENKGNGFYRRNLGTSQGNLELSVPRDRKNGFRSFILPERWKRTEESYENLLMSLVTNGYSESKITNILKSFGLPFSEKEINRIRDELKERLNDIRTRELPGELLVIYIDGYHTKVKSGGKVKNAVVYVIVGIDMEGKKELLGYYVLFGNETKGDWLKIFNDFINRGVKKVLLIISDDFSGLKEAIKAVYPLSDHQLCYVHFQRNVRRNFGKGDANAFNNGLKQIKLSKDYEEGIEQFSQLCERYKSKYPSFINYILGNKEEYLCFLKYPEKVRKYIYTTNVVENMNRQIERIRDSLGGYFQSQEILEINIYLQSEKLAHGRWSKPQPVFKSCLYELLQKFKLKFENRESL